MEVAVLEMGVMAAQMVLAEMAAPIKPLRPNLAVNRTPAGGAGHGAHLICAGYLTR
jgi:hypothetical protein